MMTRFRMWLAMLILPPGCAIGKDVSKAMVALADRIAALEAEVAVLRAEQITCEIMGSGKPAPTRPRGSVRPIASAPLSPPPPKPKR